MKCPSCEKVNKNPAYCSNCGIDLVLYDKVHMMAVRLYNKGLEEAKGRCLSGGIESLSLCLSLKKNYEDARNLLGLIYWEIGEVGQAIYHWTVSLKYDPKDNIASTYLETIGQDTGLLAKYSDTMILYNKSLQYMTQGSEDMAIISLRKAISQNPNYIEVKVLLSLYYITRNQNEKAKELLEEILLINKDHPKANHYWNEISQERGLIHEQSKKATSQRQPKIQPVSPRINAPMIEPKPFKGNIIAFILGAICMFGVYKALMIPSKTADLQNQVRMAQDKAIVLEEKLQGLMEGQEESLKNLQDENQKLERANQMLQEEQNIQQQSIEFQSVQNLFKAKEWIQAADKLSNIERENLGAEMQEEYDVLIKEIYPKAGEMLYNQGYKEYQGKDYGKALQLLEKSYIYAKEERFSDNTLYIMGRSYEAQGDTNQAKQYYQSVMDNYPKTDGATSAKKRLTNLQ